MVQCNDGKSCHLSVLKIQYVNRPPSLWPEICFSTLNKIEVSNYRIEYVSWRALHQNTRKTIKPRVEANKTDVISSVQTENQKFPLNETGLSSVRLRSFIVTCFSSYSIFTGSVSVVLKQLKILYCILFGEYSLSTWGVRNISGLNIADQSWPEK